MAGSVRMVWLALLAVLTCSVAGAQASISAQLCEAFGGCGPPLARATTSIGVVAIDTIELGSSPDPLGHTLSPNGFIVTLSGDLGNLDPRNPGCIRQGGVIVGGSFIAGFDTVYATPGTRTVSATLQKCVWTLDPGSPDGEGLVPDAALFTVSGTFTVLPSGGPTPVPTPTPTPTPSLQAALIDPVQSTINSVDGGGPSFIDGNLVTTDPDLLPQATVEVGGVAADGVTQVLVKVTGDLAGDTLTLTVMNGQNSRSGSTEEDGGLINLEDNPSQAASTVQVQPASPSDGGDPVAFVLYRAPVDFSRGSQDDLLRNRSVSIQVQSQNFSGATTEVDVAILRPPVVLVHGLWSGPDAWNNFGSSADGLFVHDPRFSVTIADYSKNLAGIIQSTNPRYQPADLAKTTRASLGLAFNAPLILKTTTNAASEFRKENQVAAVQVDIVAHSLGGLIVRTTRLRANYLVPVDQNHPNDSLSFGQGPLHKMITIGTPHLGSPLATQLLLPENDCMRVGLADLGDKPSLLTATLTSGQSIQGAVADLDRHSAALAGLQQRGSLPTLLPVAYIAGKMTPANLAGLSCAHDILHNVLTAPKKCGILFGIRVLCGHSPLGHSPLARDFTPAGWPTIFGGDSDAIVGLASQLNGGSGVEIPGLIHTPGFEKVNFRGPAELDRDSGVSKAVIQLLNEKLSGSHYNGLTP